VSTRVVRISYPEDPPSIFAQSHQKEKPVIHATIRMTIPPKKQDEALKILRTIGEQCMDDPACLGFHIYGDQQEKDVIMLDEVWKDQAKLDLHIRSDEYRNLLLVLEMAIEQPEIRFETISCSTGIETIENARSDAT
jgi:quinol monooxygenase YgiN